MMFRLCFRYGCIHKQLRQHGSVINNRFAVQIVYLSEDIVGFRLFSIKGHNYRVQLCNDVPTEDPKELQCTAGQFN
jgi:hypothetical protein